MLVARRLRSGVVIAALMPLALVASVAAGDEGAEATAARSKHQVEQLMNEGLRFAEKMLGEEGEFIPFGAVRLSDGPVRIVGTSGSSERPAPDAVLSQLLAELREGAQRREYVAIAVFANVEIPRPPGGEVVPAVFVGLEHLEGYCADVFFPYVRTAGQVELLPSFASPREGSVFGSCGELAE